MSHETLHTAARRVVRFLNINLHKDGGIITEETQKALLTLDIQVALEASRQKRGSEKMANTIAAKDGVYHDHADRGYAYVCQTCGARATKLFAPGGETERIWNRTDVVPICDECIKTREEDKAK